MNLLQKKRHERITQSAKRDQLKLNHMKNDINRNKAPSKTISLMYANKDNKENIVLMEKEKKSVSMIPKERMNEIRLGEKGNTTTLNSISKKISTNQVKNVHSGYNKYWIFNGGIYAVKPGSTVRVDNGSTPSAVNIYARNMIFSFNEPRKRLVGREYKDWMDSGGGDDYRMDIQYASSWEPTIYTYDYKIGSKDNNLSSTLKRTYPLYVTNTNPIRPSNLVINTGYEEHMILENRDIRRRFPIVSYLPYVYTGGQYRLDYEPAKNRFHVVGYDGFVKNYYIYPNIRFNYLFAMDADWVHNRAIGDVNGTTGEYNVLADTDNNYGLGFGVPGYDNTMNGRHIWDANNGYLVWWDYIR